jgi:ribosomal protein L37E
MINSVELCPQCGHLAEYDSYFNKHFCNECGFNQLIVRKNEHWINELPLNCFNVHTVKTKVNEIIKVINKITNPDVNNKNVIR